MTTTDVREWAQREGLKVSERGSVGKAVQDAYAAAHPAPTLPEGGPSDPLVFGDDYDGVTAADFPADPEPGSDERPPRPPERPAKGIKGLFSGLRSKSGDGKTRRRKARIPLNSFAEGVWTDLADVAPWPPLKAAFRFQSAYAAMVFDDAVKGTFIDPLIQPIAKADSTLRALDGLFGVPVFTAMICVAGSAETDQAGQNLYDENGWPVWDARTELMFMGLKYSVRQMLRFSDVRLEEIEAKSAEMEERDRKADLMIAAMFASLRKPPAQDQAPEDGPPVPEGAVRQMGNGRPVVTAAAPGPVPFKPAQAQRQHRAAGKQYPKPPVMDTTGADPKRS